MANPAFGQIGQGRAINRPTPAMVAGIPAISDVSLSQHILAVDSTVTKQVWSWGENSCGQLGPRNSTVTTKPSAVIGATNMMRVAAGGCFSLALKADGTVWGWGLVPGYGTQTGMRPLSGLTGIVDIQAGTAHALARRNDNTVVAFGENANGQLGLGVPGAAQAATSVPGLTNVVEITAGRDSSAVRLSNGQIYFWGKQADENLVLAPTLQPAPGSTPASISLAGSELQAALADGSVASLIPPAGIWQAVSGYSGITRIEAAVGFNLGVGSGGQVYARGTNTAGQLGQGNTNTYATVVTVPGMSNVSMVAAAALNPSVLALKGDGSLWFWGADTLGESGDGGVIGSSVPLAIGIPVAIRQIATGDRFSVALAVNGDVWGWGDNAGASLDDTRVNRATPAKIAYASNVQSIAAGGPGLVLYHHSDGRVSRSGTLLPGVVADTPAEIPGLNSSVAIAAGSSGYALKSDNRLFAFGGNASGELGNGNTTSTVVPVQVQGIGGTITQLSGGLHRAAAVTSDGKAWSWGAGPLGNGSAGNALTAVQVTGIGDAADVSAGQVATMVRRTGGGLLAWGDTGLSDAASQNTLLPYAVAFHEPVRSARLGAANQIGYLIGNKGLLWGFGLSGTTSNLSAALGDGTYVARSRPVVVNAVGGAGNIDTNDWFLDLEPASAETIPAASIPKVLGQSDLSGYGGADGLTLSAALKGRAADQGKFLHTFVFAFVPADFLEKVKVSPSLTKARVKDLQKAGSLLFLQLTQDGWADATGQLIAYTSGVLNGYQQAVKPLNGTPITAIPGVRFCIGYGESAGKMLISGTLLEVLRVGGALTSEGGSSCVLNGVYVNGPDRSQAGTTASFQATVVGATPTGKVQFKDTPQGAATQDLQDKKDLVLANEAVATASVSTNTLTTGLHTIGADYLGNTQNAPRSADLVKQHWVDGALSVTLTGPNGSRFGDTVTFNAAVAGNDPTGNVQFMVDGVDFQGPVPLSSEKVATLTTAALALGTRHVTARYGNVMSNDVAHTVSPNSATVALTASPASAQAGTPVTLTATVSGSTPTGSIAFGNGALPLGSMNLTNGVASLVVANLPPGLNRVTADYGGDGSNGKGSAATYVRVTEAPTLVTVAVARLGQGSGIVASNPAGIACGATCSAQFFTGSSVTLTATADSGSTFVGWTGACAGSGACVLSIEAARSVSARFEIAGTGVTIAPSSLAFGGQPIYTTSPAKPATLTNGSGAPITVTSIVVPTGFGASHSCATVPVGGSCSVSVTFTPQTEGPFSSNVAVLYTQSGETRASILGVTGNGDPMDPLGDIDGDGIPNGVEAGEGRNPLVKDNDVFGSARLFAMQQYRDFLGREGDAGGIAAWGGNVQSGAQSRGQVIESFFTSAEFQGTIAPVARLYFAYFLRVPEYQGINFWIGYYRAGNSLEAISNFFAGSPEFTSRYGSLDNGQFVTLVYNNVLGRAPDGPGLAYWTGRLDSGAMTRGQVMLGFSESAEYRQTSDSMVYVTMMYIGMLRRAPEAGGFSFWVQYRNSGNSGLALINGFLGSPEYRSRFLP